MQLPSINIDLKGIEKNAARLKSKCKKKGIKLTGVVKGGAGDKRVASAFLKGGINSLGDSRIQNLLPLKKLIKKEKGEVELMLLRLPQTGEINQIIKEIDVVLVSEIKTIRALSRAAAPGRNQDVILMVDIGDLREGILPENIIKFVDEIKDLSGIRIRGLGTNVGCYGGVLPTANNTSILLKLKGKIRKKFDLNLDIISGGNTATTILFQNDRMPAGVNNLRVGEAILQGTDITNQRRIDYLKQDNFTITAEIIELKQKPSLPSGKLGSNAFGEKPQFKDRGLRKRAILALGKQDIRIRGLTPRQEGIEIMGASSDHLLVDVTAVGTGINREKDNADRLEVGDKLDFRLNYGAMLAAMTSKYVHKNYI